MSKTKRLKIGRKLVSTVMRYGEFFSVKHMLRHVSMSVLLQVIPTRKKMPNRDIVRFMKVS